MTLLGPFDRSFPTLLPGARRVPACPTPVPPPAPEPVEPSGDAPPDADHLRAVSELVARALLADPAAVTDTLLALEGVLDEAVVMWSPALQITSRDELLAALLGSDDALSHVQLTLVRAVVEGRTTCVEWRVHGLFDKAGFLNDDILVEPSRAAVECAGVLVLTFSGERVSAIRCFYDSLSLLEQMLPVSMAPTARGRGSEAT